MSRGRQSRNRAPARNRDLQLIADPSARRPQPNSSAANLQLIALARLLARQAARDLQPNRTITSQNNETEGDNDV